MFRNGTGDRIEEQTYPLTATELERELGDAELELPGSTETIGDILQQISCDETFQTPEDVRYTLYGGVSDQAIGRKRYSDRDPTPLGSPEGPDVVSF